MASPQKENGFTPIANEVIEQLVKLRIPPSEKDILLFILRKTYGYHKKADRISLTQFQKGTNLSRVTVIKALKNLMTRNIVVKVYLPDGKEGYTFIKDNEKWVVKTHLLVKDKWVTSKGIFTETSKGTYTHKRKKENTKDIVASDTPFSLKEEIKKLEDNPRRDLNIVALYFEQRQPKFEDYKQYNIALTRHLKPAGQLSNFSDNQILKAIDYAKREYKDIYTLETLIKILTK